MPSLTIEDGDGRRELALTDALTIGRDPENALVIPETRVSRHHCTIRPGAGGRWELEDAGSAAGTRVDGQKVSKCPLKPGQLIQVGSCKLTFHDELEAGDELELTMQRFDASKISDTYGLYCLGGSRRGEVYVFDGPLRIGRAPDCDVILDGAGVSTYHAELEALVDGVIVRDLDSTNGTKLDGEPVAELRAETGQRLEIGEHTMVIERYPLETQTSLAPAAAAFGLELGLTAAISLMLWVLAARLIVLPLLGEEPIDAPQLDPTEVPFVELDTSTGRSKHFEVSVSGVWTLDIPPGERSLRVRGSGDLGSELRAVLHRALPLDDGWAASGRIEARRGQARVALFARYYAEDGRPLGVHYSPQLALEDKATELRFAFPPASGAAWIQPGYLVGGRCREALLGPLKLERAKSPMLVNASVEQPWGQLAMSPFAEVELAASSEPVARLEFCNMGAEQGLRVSSVRHLLARSPQADLRAMTLASSRVDPGGERLEYALVGARERDGLDLSLGGAGTTHLRWAWRRPPGSVALFYKGQTQKSVRPLIDEMAFEGPGGQVLTVYFEPEVYIERRWQTADGEAWQLSFTRRELPTRRVLIMPGNRQRDRQIRILRGQLDRATQRDQLPQALRLLAQWQALEPDPREASLSKARGELIGKVEVRLRALVEAEGADAIDRLEVALEAYRGTRFEEMLESNLILRVQQALRPSDAERHRLAASMFKEGQTFAANGYWALARVSLQQVIHLAPKAPVAEKALRLLAVLPE